MLSCIAEVSTAYQVPVAAIERVIHSAKKQKTGIGPMGIPSSWIPVLGAYGFPVREVKKNPCWSVAAGTWILAIELRAKRANNGTGFAGGGSISGYLPNIPSVFERIAAQAGKHYHVPTALIVAVMAQESGFNPQAISDKDAEGLMQMIPSTAARFGVRDPFSPVQSIWGGTAYLADLLQKFHGNVRLALAGYNAGGQAVINAGYHIPPFRQTQQYVPDVLAKYQRLAGAKG